MDVGRQSTCFCLSAFYCLLLVYRHNVEIAIICRDFTVVFVPCCFPQHHLAYARIYFLIKRHLHESLKGVLSLVLDELYLI